MHDPMCVAHEIKSPFKDKNGYHEPIITIWHVDPEKDGTDDSCGWFIRGRHVPKGMIEKVAKEFESEWDQIYKSEDGYIYNRGWFNPEGENIFSVRAIVLNMYLYAAKIALNPKDKTKPGKMWDKAWKFVNKNYAQIMYFAENTRDSLRDTIVRTFEIGCRTEYTKEKRIEMIRHCASVVTCDILRNVRPWYKHPRWHIHHWRIQFRLWQQFKRRWIDKCCICGKRGFTGPSYSDWSGTKIWCDKCNDTQNKQPVKKEEAIIVEKNK